MGRKYRGALAVACYVAWASNQMPLRFAVPGIAVGLIVMTGASLYALEKRPPKSWYPGPILATAIIVAAIATWALVGWQTWLWLRSSSPSVSGFTQQQVDEKIAISTKPLQDKITALQQRNNTLEQQNNDLQQRINTLRQPPQQPSAPRPSTRNEAPTDQEAELSIWRSVNGQMLGLTRVIDLGYVALYEWNSRTKENKDVFLRYLGEFRSQLSGAIYALDSLRTQNSQYQDVASTLDGNSRPNVFPLIDQFTQVIQNNIPPDVPPWSDSIVKPFKDKLKSGLDDLKKWQSGVNETALAQIKALGGTP